LANTDTKTSTLFSIWVDDVSSAYDKLEQDLLAKIRSQRLLGMSDDEIFLRLSQDLDNQTDLFSTFKGAIGRSNDSLVNTISQVESNESVSEVAEMWIWELDPTAEKHCETCLRNSEMGQMTFSAWRELGLPGYGNTECGKYCRCQLTPIE
jgi:hypothetical protein